MNCGDIRQSLHRYIDGELEADAGAEIEKHLATCTACAHEYSQLLLLRTALRQETLRYKIPDRIRRHVSVPAKPIGLGEKRGVIPSRRFLILALSYAVVILLAWDFGRITGSERSNAGESEIIENHIRSLLTNHLTDVPSSDQHTVKPWFDGKTDFSPLVKDLTADGFPLQGGRLDYLLDHQVAVLVYRRHQHIINLFTWPADQQASSKTTESSEKGYNLVMWRNAGMTYCAVSDLNPNELNEFAQLIRK